MRAWRSLAAALGAVVILVAAAPAVAAPTRAVPVSGVTWGECPPPAPDTYRDPRQQCATLTVPLDYRRPHGRTISVEISRIATSVPALRRGVLLSNPGGPGGSGLDLPGALAAVLPPEVLDRYDLIGFDPRGVGSSTPISCAIDTSPNSITIRLPYPAPNGSIERNVAFARSTAAACDRLSGDVLPYITTANTARDMDAIRAALGERKISYIGFSYGTYLGAVYSSLFAERTDRIVLDSGVDPSLVWRDMWRTWNAGVPVRMAEFHRYAATYDAVFHLGATPAAVRATYDRVVSFLDRSPLDLGEGVTLDGNYLREVTRSLLYSDFYLPELAQAVGEVAAAIDGGAAASTARLDATLAAAEVSPANSTAVLYAVACGDVAWPRSVGLYARDVAAARTRWPLLAGMPSNIWPCAFWPNRPVEPPVAVTGQGPRNILVLQNLRDPATPYASGLGLRRTLGKRAAMISVDQGGHGVLALGTCADAGTAEFLVTGELPSHDRFCRGVPPPDPTAPTAFAAPRPYLPVGPLNGAAVLLAAADRARAAR